MTGTAQLTTPARNRTRRAILDASLTVFSRNPSASLGEVADAADVARSTLHRYFPERSDLLEALNQYAAEQIDAATERARLQEGPASDALIRLCHEYFDYWDAITWSYIESTKTGTESCDGEPLGPGLSGLIERGQSEGTIDPSLPHAWIQQTLWALLYSAWEYIQQGTSKHDALTLCLTTLRKIISPVNQQA